MLWERLRYLIPCIQWISNIASVWQQSLKILDVTSQVNIELNMTSVLMHIGCVLIKASALCRILIPVYNILIGSVTVTPGTESI